MCVTATSTPPGCRGTHWGQADAEATGVGHQNDCTPYCAAGHFHTYALSVRLSRPVVCVKGRREFSRLAWRFTAAKPAHVPRAGSETLPVQLPEAQGMSALSVERDGALLRITLARPDRRNAFDAELIGELSKAFIDVGRARAVVLAGEGASFCAGADVDWMRASVGLSLDENVADANAMRQMFEAIDRCPAPVVARVQGHALGGGAGLVAAADIAIADPETVFAFSEVKLGIIPAVISPFALAKIGPGAARRYFVTGERFDAETALRIGLVSQVAADLDAAVDRVVGELLSAGPHAARWAKRLIRERPDGPETARWIAERRASDEGQEGLRAFLEKRPPSWRDDASA